MLTPFCFFLSQRTAFRWLSDCILPFPSSSRQLPAQAHTGLLFRWRWFYFLDWFLFCPPSHIEKLHSTAEPTLLQVALCSTSIFPLERLTCVCCSSSGLVRHIHMPSLHVLEFLLKHLASDCQCVYIKVIKASDLKEAEKRDSPTLLKKPRQIAYKRRKNLLPSALPLLLLITPPLGGGPTLLYRFSCLFLRLLHSFKWLLNAPIAEMETHKYVIYCFVFFDSRSPRLSRSRLNSFLSLFCFIFSFFVPTPSVSYTKHALALSR